MAIQLRKDLGVRVAGEKGQKPDEFVARSQLVAGNNITLEYLANWDIKIHANAIAGLTATGLRMIEGIITLELLPSDASKSYAYEHGSLLSSDGSTENRFHYGTAKFNCIYHNWNMSDKDAFTATLIRMNPVSVGVGRRYVPHSVPKIVGWDANTIAIWATTVGDLDITEWVANADTHLQSYGNLLTDDLEEDAKFHFTIVEKIPQAGEL